jgi:hypothetical protein
LDNLNSQPCSIGRRKFAGLGKCFFAAAIGLTWLYEYPPSHRLWLAGVYTRKFWQTSRFPKKGILGRTRGFYEIMPPARQRRWRTQASTSPLSMIETPVRRFCEEVTGGLSGPLCLQGFGTTWGRLIPLVPCVSSRGCDGSAPPPAAQPDMEMNKVARAYSIIMLAHSLTNIMF